MKIMKFKETLRTMRLEAQWSRVIIVVLGAAIAAQAIVIHKSEVPIIIQPPGMTEEGTIVSNRASESFHKAWSNHVAQTIGNVAPGNANFVRLIMEPLLAPEIYDEGMVLIERQLDQIRRDRVAYTFEPREIEHDPDTRITYVIGRHYMHRGADDTERRNRTYEFRWDFRDYRPLLRYIDTYEGAPRRSE